MTKRISCDLHDYFEIVCMRQSNIRITIKGNVTYQGKAVDLKTLQGTELIEVQLADGKIKRINIAEVITLSACGNIPASHNFDIKL
ncbi:Rho-binding antiterminator [Pseudoalteromonas sp. G4]|uniref:Rho-binding antiterminator n=1 Tax=Pseudoalteromonas sp. G4 TaxID=2992761 RepID=UPI00237D6552|nr:Rho-binding antiterminator [Pseudoalteromonas sp. G4]MDE3272333.1 Rho-binding antiterminator [Pseudoalteromonas sp. G4]